MMKIKKMKYSILFLAFGLIAILGIVSFQASEQSPNAIIGQRYQQQFAELKQNVASLKNVVTQKGKKEDVLIGYYKVRASYKKVEFLWEYLDPIYVKEWINGAPLPKLDKAAPQLTIIEPKGLQVIDEVLFADEWNEADVLNAVVQFNDAVQQYQVQAKLTDRIIFDAMRVELIRHYNLGLTGFELPGSDLALADVNVVMTQMQTTLLEYKKSISNKDSKLFSEIELSANQSLAYIKNAKDFDSFDRLQYLITIVNPLYKNILKAQQLLGIESIYEVLPSSSKIALNYNATNLFASDFLNPFYYVNIPQKLYSSKLIELGRYLFFDPILSASNDRSCASCHNPQKGFTDGLAKSVATGFNGTVERNSPTLLNAVYSERFFHDLRADALEDQMEHVVASSKEFNTDIISIYTKLAKSNQYTSYFKEAFTEYPNPFNQQTIAFAISAYVSSLQSFNSPFDKYVRGESQNLSIAAKRGYNLFMGKATCGTCHFAPVFNGTVPPQYTESESEVLGVLENPYAKNIQIDKDDGRIAARLKEGAEFYRHSFKTPTVRNIALSAPYMHNGAYKTLQDVMDFYNKGGGVGMGLNVPYQTLPPDQLNLTGKEMSDIIAFMNSLTDTTGLTTKPLSLPLVEGESSLNNRKVGGNY